MWSFRRTGGGLQRVDPRRALRIGSSGARRVLLSPDSRCDVVTGVLADLTARRALPLWACKPSVHIDGAHLEICGDAVEARARSALPTMPNWIPWQAFSHMTDAMPWWPPKQIWFLGCDPAYPLPFRHSQRTAHPIPEPKPWPPARELRLPASCRVEPIRRLVLAAIRALPGGGGLIKTAERP
jgi:hypothetical protein